MTQATKLLLITGPAGVGKSTLCWEISALLAARDIPHAVIESDELDRVHPKPTAEQLERLRPGTRDISALNLAALWDTYRRLGHNRLIMSGVMMHPAFDRRWILQAIPDAEITIVRLSASDAELEERLGRRETGGGAAAQLERSLVQARRMAGEDMAEVVRMETDGEAPRVLAEAVVRRVGWVTRAEMSMAQGKRGAC